MRNCLLVAALLLAACSRVPLSERLATKDKGYVCKYFAQHVFEGAASEALAHREDIRRRGWEKDPDCKMVYESRMVSLSARPERRVPWEVAIGQ